MPFTYPGADVSLRSFLIICAYISRNLLSSQLYFINSVTSTLLLSTKTDSMCSSDFPMDIDVATLIARWSLTLLSACHNSINVPCIVLIPFLVGSVFLYSVVMER